MKFISGLPSLVTLEMKNLPWLQDVSFFDDRSTITHLTLAGCQSLVDFSGLNKLSELKLLDLEACDSLKSLIALKTLPSLNYLTLGNCKNLQSLDGIENLESVSELCLEGCSKLGSFTGIENLPKLIALDVSGTAVKKLSLRLRNLEDLTAKNCDLLTEFDAGGFDEIRGIDLAHCKSLDTVRGINGFHSLQSICFMGCESLQTVALSDLPQLGPVNVYDCPELKKLKLVNCGRLVGMQDLQVTDGLEELWIEDCDSFFLLRKTGRYAKKLTVKNCPVSQANADYFHKLHPEIEFDFEPSK